MIETLRVEALLDLSHTLAEELLRRVAYPWEALPLLREYILQLGKSLPESEYEEVSETVWIAKDATVAPSASIAGPCIIDHSAEIRHCAFVRGSALVGKGAVVGNSTELKNALLFDGVQVPHFNYVGDSILGYKAHMGAGAITSNVKSDQGLVILTLGGERIETGLKKLGAVLGDHAEIGCNSVLCPGSMVGRDCIIYPASCVRGVIPEGHIYKRSDAIVPRRRAEGGC